MMGVSSPWVVGCHAPCLRSCCCGPNEVVSSDRLVEELWAGAPPASGAKGLHVHVSRLSRALSAGHSDPDGQRLVSTAGGYVLRVGPEELDVQRCERLIGEGQSLLAAGRPDQC
jgi:DNA-binding SARP family transcriptional activator